jgi:hypothetical protein
MKRINVFFFFLIAISFPFMALTKSIFNEFYASSNEKDITINPPEGFHEVDSIEFIFLFVNPQFMFKEENMEKSYNVSVHPAIFESESGDAILLYPSLGFLDFTNLPQHELKLVAEDENFDTSDRIRKIFGKDMSQYCNADTAYVYNFDLGEPFRGKFTHCIGIVLRKYAHEGMALKVLTTDEGKPNAEKYMRTLLNSIRYGDAVTKKGLFLEKNAIQIQEDLKKNPPRNNPSRNRFENEHSIKALELQRQGRSI